MDILIMFDLENGKIALDLSLDTCKQQNKKMKINSRATRCTPTVKEDRS
jgi:hypothetical protein